MKKIIISCAIGATIPIFMAGCATSAPAHYTDTGGRESIVNIGQINIQDFIQAANVSVSELLGSGVLDKVANPPAVLAMSRVVNSTGQHVDTDLLTKKIRVALFQSGKALTTTTDGLGGAEDPLAKGRKDQEEFIANTKITKSPDFSLSGKIIETRAHAGNVRASTFSFQLSLTDSRGLAVWEGEKEITKQGTRSSVGF